MNSQYDPGCFTIVGATPSLSVPTPKSGKRVFYVITYHLFGKSYLRNEGGPEDKIHVRFDGTLTSAARFSTVRDALTFITQGTWAQNKRDGSWLTYLSNNMEIVRVEETPGSEHRVVLGETQEAPKGADIRYAIKTSDDYFAVNLEAPLGSTSRWTKTLSGATLFVNYSRVLYHIVNGQVVSPYDLTIVRVAIATTAPTITETVLA